MNVFEGILDVLIDGGQSIIQIERYMTRYNISDDRIKIVNVIREMLQNSVIYIAYPPEADATFNPDTIEDYWFELTDIGKTEWKELEKRWNKGEE